jgi:hypothetical protein
LISFEATTLEPDGRLSRRQWLQLGWPALGLALAGTGVRGAEKARYGGFGRARSVVLVYANGGQSQIDTWDPKPDAP